MKKILKITLMLIILMLFVSMTVQAKTNTTKIYIMCKNTRSSEPNSGNS